jgi:hypothetical protein
MNYSLRTYIIQSLHNYVKMSFHIGLLMVYGGSILRNAVKIYFRTKANGMGSTNVRLYRVIYYLDIYVLYTVL